MNDYQDLLLKIKIASNNFDLSITDYRFKLEKIIFDSKYNLSKEEKINIFNNLIKTINRHEILLKEIDESFVDLFSKFN